MEDLISNCLEIVPSSLADYKIIAHYHYVKDAPGPTEQVYKIRGIPSTGKTFPDPMGIILYSMPITNLHSRNTATKGYFRKMPSEIGRLREVNKKIRYISRIIIDPRFQKMGLGTWLLKDTLERQHVPIVETLTPVDFTNKMFQKAGFKFYLAPSPEWYKRFTNALTDVKIKIENVDSPWAVHHRIKQMSPRQKGFIEKEILLFVSHFRHRKGMKNSLNRTVFFCSKIPYPQAYLIRFNPNIPPYDTENTENEQKTKDTTQRYTQPLQTL